MTVTAILAVGCAKQSDMESLQMQVHYLSEELRQAQDALGSSQTRLEGLASDQERLRPTIQRSQMDVSFRLEEVERELATLRNQIELNSRQHETTGRDLRQQLESLEVLAARRHDDLESEQKKLVEQLQSQSAQQGEFQQQLQGIDDMLSSLESDVTELRHELAGVDEYSRETAATLATALLDASKQPLDSSVEIADKSDDESWYEYIRRLYREGKHEQVRREYPAIMAQAPNESEEAGIMYWYGSSVQQMGDQEDAILIFEELVDKYPRHWSAAFSVHKQGNAFRALGDEETARLFYRRVLSEYPDSDAANYSRNALE
ncbi:TolA-binding protein [Desulfurispira natronophila]|uniref:TolA-binding protein n=1 Tax=Desulfurispira natronophila TaxID=682562 RepID=A0A7W7Y6D6_9BACT|nr:TolA-binding protein [Desulfurispira natronophila]